MSLLSLAANATSTSNAYNWIWIIVGIFTVGGAGGVFGLAKWLKKQGARDSKIDELIHPETGVIARLEVIKTRQDASDRKIEAALKATSANGLSTDEVGDIAKRTELAVNEIGRQLERHIGATEVEHNTIWKAIDKKMDKP